MYSFSDRVCIRGGRPAPNWLTVAIALACVCPHAIAHAAQVAGSGAKAADKQTAPDAETPAAPPVEYQPLVTEQDRLDYRKYASKFAAALREGEPKGPALTMIRNGLKFRVLALSAPPAKLTLTEPEFRRRVAGERNALIRDIRIYAGFRQTNDRLKIQFRKIVLDEVIKHCKTLLQNREDVRIQAATLIGQLNLIEDDHQGNPALPYEGMLQPLMEVVSSPDQPEPVKIAALYGIRRALSDVRINFSKNDLLDTAEKLTAQLKSNQTFFWYQFALVETLSLSTIDANLSGQPFIVQSLAEVVADGKRDPRVRCAAAEALGRVPIAPNVDVSVLSYQIAALTSEMLDAYRADPKKVYWLQCFFDLYASFQPLNAGQRANNKGLLMLVAANGPFAAGKSPKFNANHPDVVKESYDRVVPVINFVLNKDHGAGKIPASVTQPLATWLKEKDPGQIVIYDGAQPITRTASQTNSVSGLSKPAP